MFRGLDGMDLPSGRLPTAQDLLANQSRAEVYYQLLPCPQAGRHPNQNIFCCYTPGLVPPGAAVFRILRFPDVSRAGSASLATGPTRPTRTTRRSPVPTRAFLGQRRRLLGHSLLLRLPLLRPHPGSPGLSGKSLRLSCSGSIRRKGITRACTALTRVSRASARQASR